MKAEIEKTLGQIACETAAQNLRLQLKDPWNAGSNHPDDIALQGHWEVVANAVRDATIDQCNKIVQLARVGEIDQDYRCVSHRILDLKRDWHDEDGKY